MEQGHLPISIIIACDNLISIMAATYPKPLLADE